MRVLALSVLALALSANGVAAARVSLGTNLGVTFLSYDDVDENYVLISGPSQGILTLLPPPGLRVGIAPEGSPVEVFFETGFMSANLDQVSFSVLQLGANVQYDFANGETHPYLAVGVGMERASSDDFLFSNDDAVGPTFGVGLGVRHRLKHGFGAIRGELRYDRLMADSDEVFFLDGNSIALKLGFDLWMN
jgi:hypothetical protein